ncbi:hypothetical protein VKS41_007100 [Umbelopsis sp. WA50703]
MATKSDPATGKTERGFMFGHEDSLPMAVSSMKMDSHQIVWGHYSGYVTITTKTISTNGRHLKRLIDFHDGPVTALATSSSLHSAVVSGGHDAIVKIWNTSSGRCVANLLGARSEIVKILIDSRKRIIAGCADGSVLSWNLDVVAIMAEARSTNSNRLTYDSPEDRPAPYSQFPDVGIAPSTAEVRVKDILYDDVKDFVVVHYSDSQKIYKYDISSGQCLAVFENPDSTAKVTCLQWDKEIESTTEEVGKAGTGWRQTRHRADIVAASNFSVLTSDEQLSTPTIRVLVSGDENGNICLFNMDSESAGSKPVIPLVSIQGHHTAISAIHIDACKIVTGSNDGWIKIWDPISGENIKILHNKIPRNAPIDRSNIDLFAVKSIVCTDYVGVAAIGNQIKTWDFSPDKQLLSRRKLRPKKSNNTGNIYGTRGQLQAEIHKEVRESQTRLAEERRAMEEATKSIQNLTLGLSDQECLDYAIMLSAETSTRGSPSTVPQASPGHEDGAAPPEDEDEALLQAVIASLETAKQEKETSAIEEENPPISHEQSSDGESAYSYEDENVESAMKDSWPSIGTASKRPSNPPMPRSPQYSTSSSSAARYSEQEYIEDEDDEELQYVLKLSMGQV